MKVLWFLPYEWVPPLATLLIVLSGMAFVVQRRAVGISLFLTALLLLIAPVFDPILDQLLDFLIEGSALFLNVAPWWLILFVVLLSGVWLTRATIAFFSNERIADETVAHLLSDFIRVILKGLLYLSPIIIIIGLLYFRSSR